MNPQVTFIILAGVILTDMWNIDRRYLNNEKFVEKNILAQQFKTRDVDQIIQRDGSIYRVLDLASGNPFSNFSMTNLGK
jgi:hypothetical protein